MRIEQQPSQLTPNRQNPMKTTAISDRINAAQGLLK
jgi:hypothetical protein